MAMIKRWFQAVRSSWAVCGSYWSTWTCWGWPKWNSMGSLHFIDFINSRYQSLHWMARRLPSLHIVTWQVGVWFAKGGTSPSASTKMHKSNTKSRWILPGWCLFLGGREVRSYKKVVQSGKKTWCTMMYRHRYHRWDISYNMLFSKLGFAVPRSPDGTNFPGSARWKIWVNHQADQSLSRNDAHVRLTVRLLEAHQFSVFKLLQGILGFFSHPRTSAASHIFAARCVQVIEWIIVIWGSTFQVLSMPILGGAAHFVIHAFMGFFQKPWSDVVGSPKKNR